MTDEDRKTLTEFLGECWHEIEDKGPYKSTCSKCGMTFGAIHSSDWNPKAFNRTFDNWTDFGAVIEKIAFKDQILSFIQWLSTFSSYASVYGDWESWELATPEERCLIILQAIREGVIK